MDHSRDEVVLIDDNSDVEMLVEVKQPKKKPRSLPKPPDKDEDDFSARVKRFLESCCVVERINLDSDSDDEKKTSSKCLNPYCPSGEDLQVAPEFVKSHFGVLKTKNQQVCMHCFNLSVKYFKELAQRIKNQENVFTVEFPKCSPVVLIDSDDEEEVLHKDELISKEGIQLLATNFDECMNSFFKKHNILFQERKGDEFLSRKVKELEKSLVDMRNDLISEEKALMSTMSNLYRAYLPQTKEVERINLPYEELRPYVKHQEQIDSKSNSSENEVIMIHEAPFSNEPKYLPVAGDLVERNKLKAGDRVYVMKVSTFSEWVPGSIEEVIQKQSEGGTVKETYRVKIDSGKQISYQKEVVAGYMAYWDPSKRQLPLGTRVIALSTANHKMPKKFFSGITAEYLTNTNKNRYLIFFDDGYAQYTRHEDVRVVCESKEDVSEYFKPGSNEFIRQYLDKFPERPMLKVRPMETIKTEYGGHWYNARVKNIDCALVQMLFLKDLRTEWIYRGSNRLYPLFSQFKMKKDQSRHRGNLRKNRPIVQYSDGIESMETSYVDYSNEIEIDQPRAVARKSSAKQVFSFWDRKSMKEPGLPDYGRIETIIPDGPEPKIYVKHTCDPKCISWTLYSSQKARGCNPLSIPHMFGFRRFQMVGDSEQDIVYKAPCGRVLRNQDEIHEYLSLTDSKLTVESFDFNFWVNIFDEMVVSERFIKIKDLSYGREKVPIPCVNTVDNSVPNYMDYITERRGCDGVFLNLDSGFLTCCDCTDNCEDKMKCACWQKTIQGYKALGRKNNTDPNSIGYKFRRLPELVSTGIYECNEMCKCKQTCLNRVVQHPLRLKLELFKTKQKGWGTRCINDIPCGAFICVYVGDILTEANANEGGKRYGDEYFAELDYIEVVEALKEDYEDEVIGGIDPDDDFEDIDFEERRFYFGSPNNESDGEFDPDFEATRMERANGRLGMKLRNRKNNKSDLRADELTLEGLDDDSSSDFREPRVPSNFDVNIVDSISEKEKPTYPSIRSYYGKDESVYIMDAKTAGNIGRYINHSCDPNIFVQNVFVDTHDLRFPWVAFFAMRYIKAGTELTWDYRYEVGSVPGKKLYCYCGSEECRGRLL